jgi:hypothetical protein
MKSIIVLGCNQNQIEYLRLLKQKFKIILLDKNKKSPGKKYAQLFFQCAYNDLIKLNYLFKKNFLHADYIFTASSHYSFIGLAFLAKKLKLKKFPSQKSISIILNKSNFYNFLIKENINIPWTKKIFYKKDLIKYKKFKEKFFLKSDLGKSPNYIYSGSINSLIKKKINWKKDNFLKKNYLLQKEFSGIEIRVNVFKKKCFCFYFKDRKILNSKDQKKFDDLKILKKLIIINKKLEVENLLVKYDIIICKNEYVVIDIGLDPPQRMLDNFKKLKKNFYRFYLNFFINN